MATSNSVFPRHFLLKPSFSNVVEKKVAIGLLIIGFLNLSVGGWLISDPDFLYVFISTIPIQPMLFRVAGGVLFLFGICYCLAIRQPFAYGSVYLAGIAGKLISGSLFLIFWLEGSLSFFLLIFGLVMYGIGLIPLLYAYYHTFRTRQQPFSATQPALPLKEAIQVYTDDRGVSLEARSYEQKVMLIFLRHFGCTFCRETLVKIAQIRSDLEQRGYNITIVHMATPMEAISYFIKHGLTDIRHISDPSCRLYRAFNLKRGSFFQIFGIKSWLRGIRIGIFKGLGVGKRIGDGFQMPGVFILYKGAVVSGIRPKNASDHPDYLDITSCPAS